MPDVAHLEYNANGNTTLTLPGVEPITISRDEAVEGDLDTIVDRILANHGFRQDGPMRGPLGGLGQTFSLDLARLDRCSHHPDTWTSENRAPRYADRCQNTPTWYVGVAKVDRTEYMRLCGEHAKPYLDADYDPETRTGVVEARWIDAAPSIDPNDLIDTIDSIAVEHAQESCPLDESIPAVLNALRAAVVLIRQRPNASGGDILATVAHHLDA